MGDVQQWQTLLVNGQNMVGDLSHPQQELREDPVQTNPCHGVRERDVCDSWVEFQAGAVPEIIFLDQYDFSAFGYPKNIVDRRVIRRMLVVNREAVPFLHRVFPQHLTV